jgi:hypothetical protein
MAEQYDQDMNDADKPGSAIDVGSETDRPQPADDNGQENWAEDAEPLTRNEYADQVQQNEAAPDHDSPADRDQDHDPHEPAVAEDGLDREELPEPRTRQEVAAEADRTDTTIPGRDQSADAATDAWIAEEDNLPEPRTRQEVADQAQSGADPYAQHPGSDVQQHERDAADWPSPEDRARLHETYLDWRTEIATGPDQGTGWDQGANVVGDKPDRSPGDRSDPPPTGEQLLEPEDQDASRAERLQRRLDREFGDVADSVKNTASSVQEILSQPPPAGHPEVPVQVGPVLGPESQHYTTPDASAIAELGLVVGVLGAHFYHWVSGKASDRRRR